MKSLVAGIVLIILIGIGGFIYRNVQERTGGPAAIACTEEAKVCPDGSSVGRTGPACEFAPCPTAGPMLLGTTPELSVVLPEGYIENKTPNVDRANGGDMTIVREFLKPSLSESVSHTIRLHQLGVSEKGIESDILSNTTLSPADMQPESIASFKKVMIAGQLFYSIVIERFEGQVQSAYYFAVDTDGSKNLYRFDIIERDVTDWMEPSLVIGNLPEHKAFLEMLSTLTLN